MADLLIQDSDNVMIVAKAEEKHQVLKFTCITERRVIFSYIMIFPWDPFSLRGVVGLSESSSRFKSSRIVRRSRNLSSYY